MTAGCLLDTNILLYISNPGAPQHAAAGGPGAQQ
jgi:hypothetical protein